jgi:aspartate aminotransferase
MIAELAELEQARFPSSDSLGPSTFHCGEIAGGEGHNILAPKCTAVCSVRVDKNLPMIEQLIEKSFPATKRISKEKIYVPGAVSGP